MTEAKSYSPISLSPLMSMEIEKQIHHPTQHHVQKSQLLFIGSSGFRANHSTVTCLFLSADIILNNGKKAKLPGMTLINLQKALISQIIKFYYTN